jgi:cell division protein FtsL
MPIAKKKKTKDFSSFFGMLFFTIVIVSVILSVGNFVRYSQLLKQYNELKEYVNNKVSEMKAENEKLKDLLAPNSLVDKYIAAANYLRDFGYDFEKILVALNDDPTTGYFMVFVVGNETSWFTVKDKEKTYFSGELKPGLSNYRFFYFKEPRIKTNYDIIVPPNATITVGKAGKVCLLFYGVGLRYHPTKVVQLTETSYENFAAKFSLYIPGNQ